MVDIVGVANVDGTSGENGNRAMNNHRLSRLLEAVEIDKREKVDVSQRSSAFVACPLPLAAPWQQQLYQAAYERACAVVAPWPPPRLAMECWN